MGAEISRGVREEALKKQQQEQQQLQQRPQSQPQHQPQLRPQSQSQQQQQQQQQPLPHEGPICDDWSLPANGEAKPSSN